MNILIVNKYFFVSGGPERYMFSVTRALESDGHKVIPLALKLDRNRESPYSHYFLESPFGSEAAKLGEERLNIFQKLKLAGRTLYYPAARKAVARIVEQESIDVVYLLNICNYISPSVIDGAKDKEVRVVMRLSDFNFVCASYCFLRDGKICMACKQNLFNAIRHKCVRGSRLQSIVRSAAIALHKYSGIYRKVDAFVCPSNIMANELVDFGLPRDRVHFLSSFVEANRYKASSSTGQYVLYFGRLSREKGVDVLLKAWLLLGDDAPSLRIIGSGKEEHALRRMAADYELWNVEFEPFLEQEAVMARLKSCAFVVIPSVCHDNSPMAAFEAMAMGKTIIASKVGGLQDQVQDGKTGLLVPAGDPRTLANAVTILVKHPERLDIMGTAARLRAEHDFNQQVHMRKLLDILQGCLFNHCSKKCDQ